MLFIIICFFCAFQPYISFTQFMQCARAAKPGELGDSQFVKNLANLLWSPEELANRSSAGHACPTRSDGTALPEATPEKKQYLRGTIIKILLLSSVFYTREFSYFEFNSIYFSRSSEAAMPIINCHHI